VTAAECARDVAGIELHGAPIAVLVDAEAIGAPDTQDGIRVRGLLSALGLDVVHVVGDGPTLPARTVACFGRDHPRTPDCHAWFVGPDACPSWMHPTDGTGSRATAKILALLGTGFVQERAAAAFRSAGAGGRTVSTAEYDHEGIVAGIDAAACVAEPRRAAPLLTPLDAGRCRELVTASLDALERCRAGNGAIGAAPPAPTTDDPDYWFFWQRDAAHVALALVATAGSGIDDALGRRARALLDSYVGFIRRLGPELERGGDVGASRCTMAGRPVGRYGDPQPDGPAATALAILTGVDDAHAALAIARPFLDYLCGSEATLPAFDLWELTVGTSFHAVNLIRRALRLGAATAATADDPAADRYLNAATRIASQLDAFRDPSTGALAHVLRPQPPWLDLTSQLDVSAVGSILLGYDPTDETMTVDDPGIVSTMGRLDDRFASRWPVNVAWRSAGRAGAGLGRFPEDCNDGSGSTGGNPWPVATLWAAQYHLRRAQGGPHLSPRDAADQAAEVVQGLGFLSFVTSHCEVMSIGEQIDGVTGASRGARPLAWAHAELLTTLSMFPRWSTSPGSRPPWPGP